MYIIGIVFLVGYKEVSGECLKSGFLQIIFNKKDEN
jgi:hypothetical protein